ncbi:hypothetical protein FB567DRAFT_615880 [Paraphoma chrysanthemicola]|uniref:Uncharacterized protein n=1 Tax=Paraphoma chrysanthemicola TaxID=798071 RepID=A0A8K0QTR0_9PLEO|nr:hypothetical protein FB567DRAFT_615880 [Paraphoma chrysanthemicola]
MPTPGLIAALSLAAVFGTALVWLAFYYVYQYIHLRCLELDHWSHIITPPAWRRECRHCEGTGRVVKVEVGERHHGKKRGRSRKRVDDGEEGNGGGMRGGDGGREEIGMQKTRRALPTTGYSQGRDGQEQYNPWHGYQGNGQAVPQMGAAYPPPTGYPSPYPQTYQQAYPQAAQVTSPFVMPAVHQRQPQQAPALATEYPAAESVSSRPYAKHTRKTSTARSMQSQPVSTAKPRPTRRRETREHKVDYIHIVDKYPSIVQKSLKREHSISPLPSASSSSSSDSAEEVPRTSIPEAKPRLEMPFQAPQFPPWGMSAPTNFPLQWSDEGKVGGRNGNARYVTPP